MSYDVLTVFSYVLVTGATGLVGSHVVDNLLSKGFKVRAVARSKRKAEAMLATRAKHASQLDFCFIEDLTSPGVFDNAVKGVDGVIHIASPYKYDFKDNEKELIIPAIKGVRSMLEASQNTDVKRVVLTSSFGVVLDMARDDSEPYTYTSQDWNPITYAEAADPAATPQDAYRGSKKFAEEAAWDFVKEKKPQFDLVTLCPSMIFGPLANPPRSVSDLNESNLILWKVVSEGPTQPLPPCRFNFWIDVRDLAEVHVRALMNKPCGGKRYIPIAPEPFTYQMASEIMRSEFFWAEDKVPTGVQEVKTHVKVDEETMKKDLPGIEYKTFRETVTDFVKQISSL